MTTTAHFTAWDVERLNEITMEDEELKRELVSALLEDTSGQLELLAQAIQQQDAGLCMRLAHYSKGACDNVGATRAAIIFKSIERDAANGQFRDCHQSVAALEREVDVLRAEAVAL